MVWSQRSCCLVRDKNWKRWKWTISNILPESSPVEIVEEAKYPTMYIISDLTWHAHIDLICTKNAI